MDPIRLGTVFLILVGISWAKQHVAIYFVNRHKAVVMFNGIHIFETLHPRLDSCWFVGQTKNEKDSLLNLPDGCEEEKDDGWIVFKGESHYIHITSKFGGSRYYGSLEPFSERLLASQRRLKRSSGHPVDYIIPDNYAEIQTQEEQALLLRQGYGMQAPREKRQTTGDQYMELAVYVDQAVYDFFAVRYLGTPAEVRKKVLNYVNGVIDTVEILYRLSSLSPSVYFNVKKIDIWNQQPAQVPVPASLNAAQYLTAFCAYAYAKGKNPDHAALLTGLNLQYGGTTDLGGLANLGTMCQNNSCSLAKTVNNGFNAAYVVAHEIGHSLNMVHDGNGAASLCSSTCCVMAPSPNKALWSTCSSAQLKDKISKLDATNSNCLTDTFKVDPLATPGQQFPDEAQCNEHSGDCSRALVYPGFEDDCLNLRCLVGQLTETVLYPRLDGSYCVGNSNTTETTWWCKGFSINYPSYILRCLGECSTCEFQGQYQVQAHVRRCDSPYANNGGKNCPGSSLRGKLCSTTKCTTGEADATAFMRTSCTASSPGTTPGTIPNVDCLFLCSQNGNVVSYVSMPNGSPCGTNGVCVNDYCFTPDCATIPDMYVFDPADCGECGPTIVDNTGPCGSEYAVDHMYTTNTTNMDEAISHQSYISEGIMGSVAVDSTDTLCNKRCIKKIYRLYHNDIRNHYYAVNQTDADKALSLGYSYDGEGRFDGKGKLPMDEGYCISEKACGATLPVYQFLNTGKTDHFYTTSRGDYNKLRNNPFSGYQYEGILCYLFVS